MSATQECSDNINGFDINRLSIAFSIGYGVFMMIIFIGVSIKGYRDVRLDIDKHANDIDYDEDNENDYKASSDQIVRKQSTFLAEIKKKGCFHYFKRWAMYTWSIRSMYIAAAVHIYDISTDIGVILEWYLLAYQQQTKGTDWPLYPVYEELNMTLLFISALVALNVYRIISAALLYNYTKKCIRFVTQFLDIELFRIIYINHKLNRTEPGNLHRFLSKIEAIFESSPQSVLQIVFLVKTVDLYANTSNNDFENEIEAIEDGNCQYDAFSPLVFASLLFSIVSVAGRFIADDKVFFDKQRAADLGFGFKDKSWALKWNNGYIVRYLWRLSDVISRVMILAFVWIVFGGYICAALLGAQLFVISCVIVCSNDEVKYDFLQYLFTTYVVGKNFKDGFWSKTFNPVMKYSLLFRMFENFVELGLVTVFVFNRDLITDCHNAFDGTWGCPPANYIQTVVLDQNFGLCCFVIAWITSVLYVILFVVIMRMKLWREVLKINKDRDISKVAYGIEKKNWKEGTFNINADRDIIKTALRGDLLTVKEMLAFGYDINGIDKKYGRNILHHLCFNQKTDAHTMDFIMLDCNCKSIVNKKGKKLGQYPIHYYIWANSDLGNDGPKQINHFVTAYGADPQAKDNDNNTLLHFASRNRHAFNNLEMVEYLRTEYQMDMNKQNDLGQCPFHFYLKWNKHSKLLYFSQFKKLYDLDFDIIDQFGFTILHWAVSNWKGKCKANIVEFVLNNGGFKYIDYKTQDGQTVEDVLNSLDEDMEENNDAEKQARKEWIVQRDLILECLGDFRSGKKVPTPNVDEIVEQCLAAEQEANKEVVVKVVEEEKKTDDNEAGDNNETQSLKSPTEKQMAVSIELGTKPNAEKLVSASIESPVETSVEDIEEP